MAKEEKHLSAEDKLNNLAAILSEPDPDEKRELTIEEDKFLARAMALINDWRHQYIMEEGRRKKLLFERFAEPVRKAIAVARETGQQIDLNNTELQPRLAAAGTYFLKLQEITDSDLAGAALDDELLKLFTELGESLDEKE